MTADIVKDWLSIVALLISIGSAAYAVLTRTGQEAHEQVADLEKRVGKLEGELAHLPDKDTSHRMEMAIARLEGQLAVMDERLKPVAAMASRMQDYVLESGK